MGAFGSRSRGASENEVKELHGIAFRRALRKQDRRLDRDAQLLRKSRRRGKARNGDDGDVARATRDTMRMGNDSSSFGAEPPPAEKGTFRASDKKEWRTAELRALRLECARRDALVFRRRESERKKRMLDTRRERREQRVVKANARWRGEDRDERETTNNDEGRKLKDDECSDVQRTSSTTSSRFDTLRKQCAGDNEMTVRRRRERELRRESSSKQVTQNGTATHTRSEHENECDTVPFDVVPLAAAAANAADVERRTSELNPPGTSRGGLRSKYEQVKVFRDGNSLFHCARLAETWLEHLEKEKAARRGDRGNQSYNNTHDYTARDRSSLRHGETVALVLRQGLRKLGHTESLETVKALREGMASRIKTVEDDVTKDGAFPHKKPLPTLRDDFEANQVDTLVVTAVNGAELLNKNIKTHCPDHGTPLDNWRRAMNEVGKRAEAELPEVDEDDDDENGDSGEFFSNAVRVVRNTYADEMARMNVPSSVLEVAALAHHLRRPITVIRGPAGDVGKDEDSQRNFDSYPPWRARCFSETFGHQHAGRGRQGFILFWELSENVPNGLPAGDFALLVPSRAERREDFSSLRKTPQRPIEEYDRPSYDSDVSFVSDVSYDDHSSVTSALYGSESENNTDNDDGLSDAGSEMSVDDLLRDHMERKLTIRSRPKKSGHWSDATPVGSEAESDFSDADMSDSNNSLWISESEASYRGSDSDASDVDDEATHRGTIGVKERVPSFMQ